jgi:ABC-type multidrug transport system fused ATPase/permease subunit
VSFEAKQNELVGVIGAVGSGKSTLLLALLNEFSNRRGDVDINGSIFYVSQEPWIYSATIKDNILFGKEYDSKKLSKVLDVCVLNEVFWSFYLSRFPKMQKICNI